MRAAQATDVPRWYGWTAMYVLHVDIEHLGLERTLKLLRNTFYWCQMVKEKCQNCACCDQQKTLPIKAFPKEY